MMRKASWYHDVFMVPKSHPYCHPLPFVRNPWLDTLHQYTLAAIFLQGGGEGCGYLMLHTYRCRQHSAHKHPTTHWCRDKMAAIMQTTFWIGFSWMKIYIYFFRKDPINYMPALVQIMTSLRPGDKPLSEPKMISVPTLICVTRYQWVNGLIELVLRVFRHDISGDSRILAFKIKETLSRVIWIIFKCI